MDGCKPLDGGDGGDGGADSDAQPSPFSNFPSLGHYRARDAVALNQPTNRQGRDPNFRCIAYRCSPRHGPLSEPVLATSSTA